MMWKTLVILWISGTTSQVYAKTDFVCGDYEFRGIIRKQDGKKFLKLYEGAMNETTFTLSPDLAKLAEMYLDDPVTVKGRLFKPIEAQRGHIESMTEATSQEQASLNGETFNDRYSREDIKTREVDLLHADLDSSVKLLKEGPCGYKSEPKKKTR
jgi:hypothetical protein